MNVMKGRRHYREVAYYCFVYGYSYKGRDERAIGVVRRIKCSVQPDRKRIELVPTENFVYENDYVKLYTSNLIMYDDEEERRYIEDKVASLTEGEAVGIGVLGIYFLHKGRWHWVKADGDNTTNSRGSKHRVFYLQSTTLNHSIPKDLEGLLGEEFIFPNDASIERYKNLVRKLGVLNIIFLNPIK